MLTLILSALLVQTPVYDKYECNGTMLDGPYKGVVLTVEQKDFNYFLTWRWPSGLVVGLGIRRGNQMAVSFVNRVDETLGVILYDIWERELSGSWSGGGGLLFEETCKVSKEAGRAPLRGPNLSM